MLAIDLARGSFQVCAVGSDGTVLYNRALSRSRLTALLSDQPTCVMAMEACATSHYWGRVAQRNGHEVRLVPAIYVKPFVKRQKNDRADAEAIAEAASRPSMRFVAVKSAETQGRAVAYCTHQCMARQRTQLINALRGHLAEFGLVAPKGRQTSSFWLRPSTTGPAICPPLCERWARSTSDRTRGSRR